jgi:hypothetical protein
MLTAALAKHLFLAVPRPALHPHARPHVHPRLLQKDSCCRQRRCH